MSYEYLHEVEEVSLTTETTQRASTLHRLLKEMRFTLHEDVFSLDRPTKPAFPVWQSASIVEVHMLKDGNEVHEPSCSWDTVVLKYLLATQPRNGIPIFAKAAADLARQLDLQMRFRGKVVSQQQLEEELVRFADEVSAAVGEPGSEDVAIHIESTYPRR